MAITREEHAPTRPTASAKPSTSEGSPAPASPSAPARDEAFYRFTDAQGRLHLVNSLASVPQAYRARAERVELTAPEPKALLPGLPSSIDTPSFALGFAAALLAALLLSFLRGRMHPLLKLGLTGGAIALVASLYFGWLRREAGSDDAWVASPSALIEDARRAVDKMNERQRAQDQTLKDIEREAK